MISMFGTLIVLAIGLYIVVIALRDLKDQADDAKHSKRINAEPTHEVIEDTTEVASVEK